MTDTIARVIVNESGSIVDVVTEEGYNRLATTTYVSASVLPSGAATEATLQDVSSSLVQISSSLEDRLGTLGQKTMAGSTPVVIASDQSVISVDDNGGSLTVDNAFIDANISDLVTEATFTSSVGEVQTTPTANTVLGRLKDINDTANTLVTEATFTSSVGEVQATPTANTVLGRLKDIEDHLTGSLGLLGQKAMSGSTPVVIASDQSVISVDDNGGSLTIDNAFIDANISDLVTEATFTSSVGEVQVTPTDYTVLGRLKDINDTANTLVTEATFTSSVGEVSATPTDYTVLGRLKDIEDHLTGSLGLLGQKAMSGSTPVVIASDQTSVLVEATISDHSGSFADIVKSGTRTAIAVEYPLLLAEMRKITRELTCLLYTSPSPRDKRQSRMPSSA